MLAMDDIKTMLVFREDDLRFKELLDEYRRAKKHLIEYLYAEGFVCAAGLERRKETASGN